MNRYEYKLTSGHKLEPKNQLQLCALLATGYNPERCRDIFKEEYEIEITSQCIRTNYLDSKKWKKIIYRMAREAERHVLKHPLAKKINRLKILQAAINEAFAWRLDKINYYEGEELSRIDKRNICTVAGLIREVRAEVEGDKPLVDQSTHYHFYKNIIKKAGLSGPPNQRRAGVDSVSPKGSRGLS